MDFFARQDHARRRTRRLILYFALAVVSIVVMIYGVALLVSFYFGMRAHHGGQPAITLWNPMLFAGVALGTLVVIFCGSAWKTMALSSGGSAVAESLGGRRVASNTNNPDERRLLNIVEEMSIASGVPMPQVYVLDEETGINAFAAGFSTSDAVVAVTRGCLKTLSRDELQGVIAHEFSHILNGDMRLNIRLIGILFGILGISAIGRILMRARGKNAAAPIFIGLLLLLIGLLGVFFGRLIQAAVSRQREFLADAASVQFTRNPSGLSGALQKIGGSGSEVNAPNASDAGHLFFGSAQTSQFMDALATHPPLEERIRAIDPNWDGQFQRLPDERVEKLFERAKPKTNAPVIDPKLVAILATAGGAIPPVIQPASVLPNLGNPTPLHLKYAEQLRDSLSENLRNTARDPLAATALIYALLLDADEKQRAGQIEEISKRTSESIAEKTVALFPEVSAAAQRARLPLVNLALGALPQLKPEEFGQFSTTLEWLANSDGKVELFEFVLIKTIQRHLAVKFNGARSATVQYYTLKPLAPDCAVVLSALANVSSEDDGEIQKAFAAGVPWLRAPAAAPVTLITREQCGVERVSAALDRLALAAPIIKKNLLEAAARVVGADGVIQETEAELLRAISDTLDCPMPPLGVSE